MQPERPQPDLKAKPIRKPQPPKKKLGNQVLGWMLLAGGLIALFLLAGAGLGYLSGNEARQKNTQGALQQELQEQYGLGVEDLAAGRYDVAFQRFQYILSRNPAYPGAAEQLAVAMQVVYATGTPTVLPATITPTPTRDPRPAEDLLTQAINMAAGGDWSGAIDTLSALRKENQAFQTAQVDGLFYLALRMRGVGKILQTGNLEGGMYDLSLAEKFGPLDAEAGVAREWARLYVFGSSFWEAYPEQAVFYFSQLAAAAPGLTDASGWSAAARLKAAIIQWGDQLALQGDWCLAQEKYEAALAMGFEAMLEAKVNEAALKCAPPTATPTPTVPVTPTLTVPAPTIPVEPSPTSPFLPSETPTLPVPPSMTPTPGDPPTSTPEPPTSTPEPTEPVRETPTPTQAAPTEEATSTPPTPPEPPRP